MWPSFFLYHIFIVSGCICRKWEERLTFGPSSFLVSCSFASLVNAENFGTWSSDLRSLLDTISQTFILTPDSRSKKDFFSSGEIGSNILFLFWVFASSFGNCNLLFRITWTFSLKLPAMGNDASEHCQCPVECVTSSLATKLFQLLF